jgi:DNA mismatch endonuclease (patch repair protein)
MQGAAGRETKPEARLRTALWALGLRFRKDVRVDPALRTRADVVFARQRVCVFLDGCYWHRCPEHFRLPRSNTAWWSRKLQRNVDRDERATAELSARGWKVIRVWEHERLDYAAARIHKEIARRRADAPLRGDERRPPKACTAPTGSLRS